MQVHEIHYKYSAAAPVYAGKVVEAWIRTSSDYTNGNGRASVVSLPEWRPLSTGQANRQRASRHPPNAPLRCLRTGMSMHAG